jgi:hypothetical protein
MVFYVFDVISFLKKLVKNDTKVVCRRGSWVVLTKESGNL